ncbi:MAG: hypothetical protein H6887_05800 [Hoeflea sp.]|nr:hypothetical protein [Hoeflea sp.]MCC0034772.1 hypothetical protein [Hoeflea sp.]
MNKIIIALGLTLAAATGAFAQSPNDYVELNAPTHGPAAEAHAAKSDMAGVDYTATASVGDTVKAERFERSLELFNR